MFRFKFRDRLCDLWLGFLRAQPRNARTITEREDMRYWCGFARYGRGVLRHGPLFYGVLRVGTPVALLEPDIDSKVI